jgi:hypothetical protein
MAAIFVEITLGDDLSNPSCVPVQLLYNRKATNGRPMNFNQPFAQAIPKSCAEYVLRLWGNSEIVRRGR